MSPTADDEGLPPAAPRRGLLGRIGRACARHPWRVALVWLVLLVGASFGHKALGGVYSDNFSLPSTPAQQGSTLLRSNVPAEGGESGQVVFTVTSGTLSKDRSAIDTSVAEVRRLPDVLSASDPLSVASTSKSGRTAYSTVHFSTNPQQLGTSYVTSFDRATGSARVTGVSVSYGGQLGQAARPKGKSSPSEILGIVAALLVLLAAFGSIFAAGLPLVAALVGAFTGVGLLGMLAAASTFATVSPTLAVMMGLGVGIDYALFLTTRHRQLLMDGLDPVEAAAQAVTTSGRAVLTAAVTVVIALLGLYASDIAFIGKLGLAAALTVAVAALGALTVVPALLAVAGRNIDRWHVRRPLAEASPSHSGWQRYAERLGAHPWRYLLAGLSVLVVLAIPFFSMRLGHVDAGADPASYSDRQAYDAIAAGFGPGANGPFTVVAALDAHATATPAARQTLESSLDRALAATPDVATVAKVKASPDGALLYATVVPRTDPQAAATLHLMDILQDKTLPAALSSAHAKGYVTGSLASQLQFRNQVSSRLPLIVAVVIAAAFLLLLLSFRSPILALNAAVMNLFSIGAAYGVIVAVFQWGWGGSALGVSGKVPIESYVPMMMFAIVFGLSMDYEVFLLSRVREAWLASRDSHQSVAHGIAVTGRVITGAAVIMAAVFLSFLLSTNVVIKMLTLGLGVSVLVDATIIRLLIVPATMFLLGRHSWWTPSWLDRRLPHLGPEAVALRPAHGLVTPPPGASESESERPCT